MNKAAIEHRPDPAFAFPVAPDRLRVRLRAARGDLVSCHVGYGDRYDPEGPEEAVAMEKVATGARHDYYEAHLHVPTRRVRYAFYLHDGREGLWYGEQGLAADRAQAGAFHFPYIGPGDAFSVPDWAADAVLYQIFPDRFANGDPSNDPAGVEPWTADARPTATSVYGGDLEGIRQKLPYLAELGVNTLYLTPIFASPSNHKYDTTDYFRIDPHFGDLDTLRALVRDAHACGMRVILDAVFNHCGYGFFAFQDVVKRGKDSPYADWFRIFDFPVRTRPQPTYETFARGVWTMPKLMTHHPAVRDYLLQVVAYWTREADIDGWRLDVANEVDPAFWRAFRQVVKGIKPDALIIGEIWHDAAPWLSGDQFDGVMHYPFRDAVVFFFATRQIDAAAFDAQLADWRMRYPEPALLASWNLLGSHDTERFLTLCGGRVERMRLAVLFQLTYLGAPMIYYGDEVGMEGGPDPDCRRPMVWDEARQNRELLGWYRQLIRLRRNCVALRRGAVRTWWVDPLVGGYGFLRLADEEVVGVALNNGPRPVAVTLDARAFGDAQQLVDALSGEAFAVERGNVTFPLLPWQGRVLVRPA